MRQVKNKDSEIELILRKALWQRGIRYRKNVKTIFGHPDIAFKGKRLPCSLIVSFGMDTKNVYRNYKKKGYTDNAPTLKEFRAELLNQEEEEAQDIICKERIYAQNNNCQRNR